FHAIPLTEIHTLSLHDALPISSRLVRDSIISGWKTWKNSRLNNMKLDNKEIFKTLNPNKVWLPILIGLGIVFYMFYSDPDINSQDRKSTRLNSSHVKISYAVCC